MRHDFVTYYRRVVRMRKNISIKHWMMEKPIMTPEELKNMGMTQEEFDKSLEEENQYINSWANRVRHKIN